MATLPPRDEAVFVACNHAADRLKACGYEVDNHCDIYAAVESPETVEVYECLAAAPCDEQTSTACEQVLAPSGVAQDACEAAKRCGLSFEFCKDTRAADRDFFNWWKVSTQQVYLACFARENCDEVSACVDAVINATNPQ